MSKIIINKQDLEALDASAPLFISEIEKRGEEVISSDFVFGRVRGGIYASHSMGVNLNVYKLMDGIEADHYIFLDPRADWVYNNRIGFSSHDSLESVLNALRKRLPQTEEW